MKFAEFFGKLWLKTQSATKKVWALVKLHKVVSIASAATVVVAGTTCAIVLPIALHNHEYSSEWMSDTQSHWHEAVCKHEGERSDVADHTYLNACDADCNVCGKVRSASHVYDDVCDTTCNVCNEVRDTGAHVFSNICDTDCDICGEVREVDAHVFSNICDPDCNVCGEIREVGAHFYDNDCDPTCSACAAERVITHTFDNACDVDCNVCDFTRKTEHNYVLTMGDDTQHWCECTGCGKALEANNHRYSNDCDATCNDCGKEREKNHSYVLEMYGHDAEQHWHECLVCGEKKDVVAHEYTDECDTSCNICKAVREVSGHDYDNNCDTVCNLCGAERSVEHKYEPCPSPNGDTHWYECSVCHVTKDEAAHIYDHSCDVTCNVCNFKREVEHSYKETYTNDGTTHWFECRICKQRKDVAVHVYDKVVSDSDKHWNECVCGVKADIEAHEYNAVKFDSNNHWNECECGVKNNVEAHEYAGKFDADNHWDECDCGFVKSVEAHAYAQKLDADNHWDECDCGFVKDVVAHEYSIAKLDSDKHWNECSCGAKANIEAHNYSAVKFSPDNHWNECICGAKAGVATHEYDEVKFDADKHWYECDCGTKKDEKAHEYSVAKNDFDNHWNECICGAKADVTAHEYSVAKRDSDNHWNECVCGVKVGIKAHEYSVAKNDSNNHWNECECGVKADVEAHEYNVAKLDSDKHWKECSCGAKADEEAHEYSLKFDTDYHWNECACGFGSDKKDKEGHKDQYVPGTLNHFVKCSVCAIEPKAEDHEYSGTCDVDCEKCAEIRNVDSLHEWDETHAWDDTNRDADSHWVNCKNCTSKKDVTAHTPEYCSDSSVHWRECKDCKYVIEKPSAHEHSYNSDEVNHWFECVCGDVKDNNNGVDDVRKHVFVDYKDASSHWTACIDCQRPKGEKADHTYGEYHKDDNEHWRYCTVCGEPETKAAHSYSDEYKTDDENHWYECVCGAQKDVAKHEYTWGSDNNGHWQKCVVCQTTTTPVAHKFQYETESEETLKTSATNEAEAVYYKSCRCGKSSKGIKEDETFTKKKNEATVTLTVSDKTYDGKPLDLAYTFVSDGEVKVEYKLKGGVMYKDYPEGGIKDAGTYVIRVTALGTIDYYAAEAIAEVTIDKATLSLEWLVPGGLTEESTDREGNPIPATPFDGEAKNPTVYITGRVDSEEVDVKLEILKAVQRIYSNGSKENEKGDPTKQDQIMSYKATLTGKDAANYVIAEGNDTLGFKINPCVHEELDEYAFCKFCGEYGGETLDWDDDFLGKVQEMEENTLFCFRFYMESAEYDGKYRLYINDFGTGDYIDDNTFDEYIQIYVKGENGLESLELDFNTEAETPLPDHSLYLVVKVDEFIKKYMFSINYEII